MSSANNARTRLATRLAFLAAGFGIACWAPLVPYAKARLNVDDGAMGLLILCIGIGSVLVMPATGMLSARLGSKPIIICGGLALALMLPALAVAPTPLLLGLALFGLGASLGSIDVAMNVHAVAVEKDSDQPLMSGFHAFFSIGGFAGSLVMTALLSSHDAPLASAVICAVLTAAMVVLAWPRLLRGPHGEEGPLLAVPHGAVLLIAVLAAITFLVEGALLDWGALLLLGKALVEPAQGGLGYMAFSIAMTVGRLGGDWVTARLGDFRILVWGGVLALAGFAVLLTAPFATVAMAGFVLIGLGASNIVPVLFRRAAAQTVMPAGLAIAAVTTTGYAGVLAGPAAIGFVAHATSLPVAFWMLAALVCLVPLTAGRVAPTRQP